VRRTRLPDDLTVVRVECRPNAGCGPMVGLEVAVGVRGADTLAIHGRPRWSPPSVPPGPVLVTQTTAPVRVQCPVPAGLSHWQRSFSPLLVWARRPTGLHATTHRSTRLATWRDWTPPWPNHRGVNVTSTQFHQRRRSGFGHMQHKTEQHGTGQGTDRDRAGGGHQAFPRMPAGPTHSERPRSRVGIVSSHSVS